MTTPTRPRGTTCETELWAMARYARRLEANLAMRRIQGGVPETEVLAAIKQERAEFGVGETMRRLFGEREAQ